MPASSVTRARVVLASGGTRSLTELLPHPLTDASQAPMLCLLEEQDHIPQGGLFGSLRGRIGLEESQGRGLLEQARIGRSVRK